MKGDLLGFFSVFVSGCNGGQQQQQQQRGDAVMQRDVIDLKERKYGGDIRGGSFLFPPEDTGFKHGIDLFDMSPFLHRGSEIMTRDSEDLSHPLCRENSADDHHAVMSA